MFYKLSKNPKDFFLCNVYIYMMYVCGLTSLSVIVNIFATMWLNPWQYPIDRERREYARRTFLIFASVSLFEMKLSSGNVRGISKSICSSYGEGM